MATPWVDLEAALWTYLEADAAFAALSLKKFKGHLGQFFPFTEIDENTVLTTPDLPAITTEPGGEFGHADSESSRGNVGRPSPVVEVLIRVMYGSQRGDQDRNDLDAAVDAVMTRLNGQSAQRTNLGEGSAVAQFRFTPQTLSVARSNGKPIYWVWSGIVRLEGAIQQ